MPLTFQFCGKFFGKVNDQFIFFPGVNHKNLFTIHFDHTAITHLATTLCIERSFIQHELKQFFILLLDLSVFDQARN